MELRTPRSGAGPRRRRTLRRETDQLELTPAQMPVAASLLLAQVCVETDGGERSQLCSQTLEFVSHSCHPSSHLSADPVADTRLDRHYFGLCGNPAALRAEGRALCGVSYSVVSKTVPDWLLAQRVFAPGRETQWTWCLFVSPGGTPREQTPTLADRRLLGRVGPPLRGDRRPRPDVQHQRGGPRCSG